MKPMTQYLRNIRNSYTFRLRKHTPTFVEGVASALEVGGHLMNKYNVDKTDNQADANSLGADWQAVGNDMYSALSQYARTQRAQ